MKKIVIVSPVVSHPQSSGSTTRVSEICNFISKLGFEVHFCYFKTPSFESHWQDNVMLEKWGDRLHILTSKVDHSRSWRYTLLNKFKQFTSQYRRNFFTNLILDFHFSDHVTNCNDACNFEQLIEEIKPYAIVLEYAILHNLVTKIPSNIIKIVDTHDVFSHRNIRIRKEGGSSDWLSYFPFQEKRMLKKFNYVIAIQKEEKLYFQNMLKNTQSCVILVDILEGETKENKKKESDYNIGFIGAKSNHNFEGLKFFIENHWKKITQQIPAAKLYIAGATYNDFIQYENLGIKMIGRVPNLDDFYQNVDIIINPTFAGSGLKIKSVEALMYGKALITTPEGAVGLEKGIQKKCIYCSKLNSPEFSDNLITVLKKSDLFFIQKAAHEFVMSKQQRSKIKLKNTLL
jgi:glycosyltransferase involved in cell wall biosynthesis